MNLSDTVTIPTQVMARQVGDETVILDLASGTYFGLDAMGTRIWQLIGQGQTLAEICTVLLTEYDVSAEELERDLLRLVQELDAQGLIHIA
jgi:PqqD family protein of HPr-rel-A system